MTWLSTFSIALLSGLLGLVCAGFIAAFCADWFRISNFEGKAGFFMVAVAMLGGIAAFFVGPLAMRLITAGAVPGFFKRLIVAWGAVLAISLAALAICRWFADVAPKMDGKSLALEIEVRCPKTFVLPKVVDEYGVTAEVYLPRRARQPIANLRLDDAKTVEGFLIVPVTVPLATSSSQKSLEVRFDKSHSLTFGLPLRSQPRASDREWSNWIESGWDAGKSEPAKEAKFNLRFRVATVEPPPPPRDPAVVRAQEFAALKPDATLEQLLPFLFEGPTPESIRVVVKGIEERQAELAKLMRSTNATMREYAMRAAEYAPKPTPELVEAVLAEGRDIAAIIRTFNALPATDPKYHEVPFDLRSRFNDWKQAWWTISRRLGVDGRPPVQEIYDIATVRARGTAMDEIEGNARVILDALNSEAEKKP